MEITTTLCLPLILVLSNCMFMQKKYTSILEEAEQSVRKADSGDLKASLSKVLSTW